MAPQNAPPAGSASADATTAAALDGVDTQVTWRPVLQMAEKRRKSAEKDIYIYNVYMIYVYIYIYIYMYSIHI